MKNLMEKLDKEEEDLAAARDYLLNARPMLSIEQDLELVKQGVKTRKPVVYGHKVMIKR